MRRMNDSNSRWHVRLLPFSAAVLSLLGLITPTPLSHARPLPPQASECQGGVGGRLFSNGGRIEVEMLQADAGFTIELHLLSPGGDRFIATNREVGTTVNLGTFSEGTELIFGAFVRDTHQTFVMGPGSSNPDGIAHAQVDCFNSRRANVGFEDQMGGGDRDYNDLLCTVRQIADNCDYSVSPSSQSFGSGGGGGSLTVTPSSGCSWTAVSNANWIAVTSGDSGSSRGTVNYSVASNNDFNSRTGTIAVQGQTFTVSQDGLGGQPLITSAVRDGKKLYVYGINFDSGSSILLNGDFEKTKRDPDNPTTILIGKKAGKRVHPGDTLRVQTSSGVFSPEYTYEP